LFIEIKHNYDFEKLKNLPLDKFSTYKTSVTMYKDMVGPIKSMFYKLYYLNNIENLVRPTELYAKLKSEGITKNEFLNFFKKEYRILFDSEKFKLKDLIKELKSDIGHIESILGKFVDMKNMSDDEKIKEYLTATYRLYVREAEMLYKTKIIGHSFFNTKDVIKNTEIEGIHKKSYDNFMKDLKKYLSDPIKFYNNVEKEINSSATKMIKKLSKVYSLLPE
jgi:hypothetical protein